MLLTYYGDDLTGSTDTMEALTLGGVPTVLFLQTPTPEQIAREFPNARAVGIAGVSRSMSPAQMDAELPTPFAALKALNADFFHYKVCSTFDSSPDVGSIGRALDIGWDVFQPCVVPVVVGSPNLKRYVAFGNLFARVGDVTYRLDRHPTMSQHPITPMHESDLRLHLGQQTARKIGLIDVLTLDAGDETIKTRLQSLDAEVVLFDTLHTEHLRQVGRVLWDLAQNGQKFVVGSSGVENALTLYWQESGLVQPLESIPPPGKVDQLVVMSGSASPVTAAQIEWARANGYTGVQLDVAALLDAECCEAERERAITEALATCGDNGVILYSTLAQAGLLPAREAMGVRLGTQQGLILREILQRTGWRRACVAGGDTSGYVARQLGVYALEMLTPIAPGAPLCRAFSDTFAGLELALKGGQNGGVDYFERLRGVY